MTVFLKPFVLSAPLFAIVLVGYLIALQRRWRSSWTAFASKFVFMVALPALLFHMMSGLSSLPPVDARLLIAFFGGCFLVFALGRIIAARAFHLDAASQSVFALGGVFSNVVLLGLPLAKLTLGEAAAPSVALVLVFNSLSLWTLVTVSVEWARHGAFTRAGFAKTAVSVARNPIVAAILTGTLVGLAGWRLPRWIDVPLTGLSQLAAPVALLTLGMSLVHYGVRAGWREAVAICALKLVVQPLVVWLLASAIGLHALETSVVVLLASMSVGVNVYLMAAQFDTLQSTVASSLVLLTVLAAVTTPIWLSLLHALAS
jgi:malonate transporter and related proteins